MTLSTQSPATTVIDGFLEGPGFLNGLTYVPNPGEPGLVLLGGQTVTASPTLTYIDPTAIVIEGADGPHTFVNTGNAPSPAPSPAMQATTVIDGMAIGNMVVGGATFLPFPSDAGLLLSGGPTSSVSSTTVVSPTRIVIDDFNTAFTFQEILQPSSTTSVSTTTLTDTTTATTTLTNTTTLTDTTTATTTLTNTTTLTDTTTATTTVTPATVTTTQTAISVTTVMDTSTVTATTTASPITVTTTQTTPPSTVTAVSTVIQPTTAIVTTTVLQPTTITQVVATTVTAPGVTTLAAPSVTLDSTVYLENPHTFYLTGSINPASDVAQIEFYAQEKGQVRDLGAATLDKDGTFSFSDVLTKGTQGSITAVATNAAGNTSSAVESFSLSGNRQITYDAAGNYTGSTLFNPDGTPKTVTTVAPDGTPLTTVKFRPDGRSVTHIQSPGQTIEAPDSGKNVFDNGGAPETHFVFNPGDGRDIVNEFRVGGPDHDTLDLSSSQFASVRDVLVATKDTAQGVQIHEPSGDTIAIKGVSKAQLAANKDDIVFHG